MKYLFILLFSSLVLANPCSLRFSKNSTHSRIVENALERAGFDIVGKNETAVYEASLTKKWFLNFSGYPSVYMRNLNLTIKKGSKLIFNKDTQDGFPGLFFIYSDMRKSIEESGQYCW